jgi:hypothetical protein
MAEAKAHHNNGQAANLAAPGNAIGIIVFAQLRSIRHQGPRHISLDDVPQLFDLLRRCAPLPEGPNEGQKQERHHVAQGRRLLALHAGLLTEGQGDDKPFRAGGFARAECAICQSWDRTTPENHSREILTHDLINITNSQMRRASAAVPTVGGLWTYGEGIFKRKIARLYFPVPLNRIKIAGRMNKTRRRKSTTMKPASCYF